MNGSKNTISIMGLVISLVTLGLVIYLVVIPGDRRGEERFSVEKNLAGELTDNNLYRAAIDEYKKILNSDKTDSETKANINYLVGKIYFENLHDYEDAAAHYVMARALNPEGSFYNEAGKNLIASLEKMGRIVDAKRELDKSANIDSVAAAGQGKTMVAKIGEIPVYLTDLEKEIQNLPPEMQKQYLGAEGKKNFLWQYIGLELMYRAAIREGLENDPEIVDKKNQFEKQLMAEKYIVENVMPQVNIDSNDVANYYAAHKADKYADKAYDEVKTQVFFDYQQDKAQQAFSDYVQKLAAAEKVQVFEDNLR
nr:hypothetical protein [candidate division Zixibacteria bacterium]